MQDQAERLKRNILVVDNQPDHVGLIQEVLKADAYQILALCDRQQALDVLYQRGNYQTALRPDLILLDLNLPDLEGWHILKTLKDDQKLRRIPVVVFTSSTANISQAYELHSNSYVLKSEDIDQLPQIIKRIEAFWLEIVTLPAQ
jgi:two-component system, chemotaxis family, response regulator Rcp1